MPDILPIPLASCSKARANKPHTRETVWAEGLLAGMLHQSITARRADMLRTGISGGGASGGGSAGGAGAPSHGGVTSMAWRGASMTNAGRAGSEWEGGVSGVEGGARTGRRSRRTSVDNLIMDLNTKSRAKLGRISVKQ